MDADLSKAVALARQAVGAPDDLPTRATRVRRLDRDAGYVLVDLGTPGSAGWVAAVDPVHDDVMAWAVNASGQSTVPALPGDVGGAGGVRTAEYVWRPSVHSRSPLYPLLRVVTDAGEQFVDLAGRMHDDLPEGRA